MRTGSGTSLGDHDHDVVDGVNIEGLLIAAGQNLKRFLAATGWGRRHAPCGSLVAILGEPARLTVVYGW